MGGCSLLTGRDIGVPAAYFPPTFPAGGTKPKLTPALYKAILDVIAIQCPAGRMNMKIRIRFLSHWEHPYRGDSYEPGDTAFLARATAEILCKYGIAETLEFSVAPRTNK